jgi:hypothetical protein
MATSILTLLLVIFFFFAKMWGFKQRWSITTPRVTIPTLFTQELFTFSTFSHQVFANATTLFHFVIVLHRWLNFVGAW